ncbi:hypothetical protein IPL68_05720 [Candidatus Saccharibacteria bacterium]|nr:MAG: hypothetical protein IPL68_05720 [Candidatus Saccharibacteria bacterium]
MAAKNTSRLPEWKIEQFTSVNNVNEVKLAETNDWQHTIIWAWEDELAGRIRMRTFAPDWGIPEAESNGSGAMLLSAQMRKPLEIHHGRNSVLYTRPGEKGLLALGGRCNLKTSEEE